jgi:hypothetical protein
VIADGGAVATGSLKKRSRGGVGVTQAQERDSSLQEREQLVTALRHKGREVEALQAERAQCVAHALFDGVCGLGRSMCLRPSSC